MDERRRLLMLSQIRVGTIDTCPVYETDSDFDGSDSQESLVKYCPLCKAPTLHYHHVADSMPDSGIICSTIWCSVCGSYDTACPECHSTNISVTDRCSECGEEYSWRCNDCNNYWGYSHSCDGGGDGGDETHECPNCGGSSWTHHTGKCATGACDVSYDVCDECGYVDGDDGSDHTDCGDDQFTCPECGSTNISSADLGLLTPDGSMTCPGCNRTLTRAYKCGSCGLWICPYCSSYLE